MGGYGSSRWGWHRKKLTTAQCLSLDVSKLRRRGYLEPNSTVPLGVVKWASGSRMNFTLRTEATDGEAVLFYSLNGQSVGPYAVRLATTRPRFGGVRWWWLCPGCERRARILYLSPHNGRFECRLCCGLTYRSAQEHNKTLDRYMRLPPQALAQVMNGNGRESLRAAMAVMERSARGVERIGRFAGVLDPGWRTSGEWGEE